MTRAILKWIMRRVHHYSHAIELRTELLNELLRASSSPHNPRNLVRKILTTPAGVAPSVTLLRCLRPDESIVLLDIGANDGAWAEQFLELYSFTEAHCFEPTAAPFARLTERFCDNPSVKLYNVAASNVRGVRQMHIARESACSSFHEYEVFHEYMDSVEVVGEQDVRTERVDDLVADLQRDRRRKIAKIDVQGHEVEVLVGMERTLRDLDIVLIETCFIPEYLGKSPSFAEVVGLLQRAGLYPAILNDHGRQLGPFAVELDVFFLKESLLRNVCGW